MTATPAICPRLRPGLDCIRQPLPQQPDRLLLRDPQSRAVLQLGAREWFILQRFDGEQSVATIRRAFEAKYGQTVSPAHLKALIGKKAKRDINLNEMISWEMF